MVTSTGQNDSGLFEANLRDERFLPFENAGAISSWQLNLPDEFRPFDYDTISDVILHFRYTAREGGDDLKGAAVGALRDGLNELTRMSQGTGLTRMFSLRRDFPTEWYRLTNPDDDTATATVELAIGRNRFPYLFRDVRVGMTINGVDAYAVPAFDVDDPEFPGFVSLLPPGETDPLEWEDGTTIGPLVGKSAEANVAVTHAEQSAIWRIEVAQEDVASLKDDFTDLLLVFRYTLS